MILWYRFLDSLGSTWRRSWKSIANRQRWGRDWRDSVRSGRRYSRVELDSERLEAYWRIRSEPGWEWVCQNCKTRSLVLPSMVAVWTIGDGPIRTDMIQEWQDLSAKTVARGFKPPVKPTPATAPCPNCHYRPGAPE